MGRVHAGRGQVQRNHTKTLARSRTRHLTLRRSELGWPRNRPEASSGVGLRRTSLRRQLFGRRFVISSSGTQTILLSHCPKNTLTCNLFTEPKPPPTPPQPPPPLPSRFPTTTLPNHHTSRPSHFPTTTFPNHHTSQPSHFPTATPPNHHSSQPPPPPTHSLFLSPPRPSPPPPPCVRSTFRLGA